MRNLLVIRRPNISKYMTIVTDLEFKFQQPYGVISLPREMRLQPCSYFRVGNGAMNTVIIVYWKHNRVLIDPINDDLIRLRNQLEFSANNT